jgi:exonuclease SbcD
MRLDYDNRRTRSQNAADSAQQVEQLSPLQLFAQLYEKQNNQPMSPEQTEFAAGLIEAIWEGEK